MHIKRYIIVSFILTSFSFCCFAENENEYFSNPDSMITENTSSKNPPLLKEEKKSIGFSGELTSAMINNVLLSSSTTDSLYTFTVCNLFLDARLKNMMKVFANIEIGINSQTNATTTYWRELFFDFNLDKKVYFRTGKQVLQWGRCYLWNPTDFINIEKIPFIRKIGYREGTYGVKVHVPFGTKYNLYSFIDTNGANKSEDASGAFKFEFLCGNTEMALSTWLKSQKSPAYGYDFSSRLFHIDLLGEISVSKDDISDRMIEENGVLRTGRLNGQWSPRASLAMTKYFDLGNFNDRISVTNEFFYNGTGYTDDVFGDNNIYSFSGTPISGTKKMFFLASGLYSQNYYSKYYDAVFISVGRFIVTDMTFNLNYIRNCNDNSGILSSGVTYKNLSDFSFGLLVNSFIGEQNREYSILNTKFDIELTVGITF
ncbi:MAG: hypothetical protein LHV68_00115 [Elusimicrobia bacterium]|nr:hypothetical protein [Candidatus Liberimonas magnetica]